MSPLELLATVMTVASVVLTAFRRIEQFPVGLLAVAAFTFVFWEARLYASTALQGLFACLTLYGWWYWLHGDRGRAPRISHASVPAILVLVTAALLGAAGLSTLLATYTDARMTYADSAILGLSVVGQLLLDRKKIEHWLVWAVVNMLSIAVYTSQGLSLTALLYGGLLANTVAGYLMWRKAMRLEGTTTLRAGV